MLNKKTLTLKMNKSLHGDFDAPLTPVDQTLKTPVDPPNHMPNSYFGGPSSNSGAVAPTPGSSSFYHHPAHAESDDILTDVDEPLLGPKLLKSYSLTFTPLFDQLVLGIYSDIMLLPTTTPFLGCVPPLGLVSRVANETMLSLMKNNTEQAPLYDTQCVLSLDYLKNHFMGYKRSATREVSIIAKFNHTILLHHALIDTSTEQIWSCPQKCTCVSQRLSEIKPNVY